MPQIIKGHNKNITQETLNCHCRLKKDFPHNSDCRKESIYKYTNAQQQPMHCTKIKFSIKYFSSKCGHIHFSLWIWLHLLNKSLMKNFIFCAAVARKKYILD